jgi:hypothetical protein
VSLVNVGGLPSFPIDSGPFELDEDDFLLYGMLTDPVYLPELTWSDASNWEYGGEYRVRDYQYIIFRMDDQYAIIACARSVGKSESEKVHAQIHLLTRYDNMLITAPELIHLLPLTDAIEDKIHDSPLLGEMLDTRYGATGFQHRPFQTNFIDGTKIVGRIPQRDGRGVRGQHQSRLIVEEGQDYPAKGWIEVNETVSYDATNKRGEPDFRYWVYGVHGGNKASGFDERARSPLYRKIKVTSLRRPDWNATRKANAVAAYGGTSSPDYKRNILGEPGAGATAYFVTARVLACVDQRYTRGEELGSEYNVNGYVAQRFRAEELDDLGMTVTDLLDLPDIPNRGWWGGMDIGLTDSPTVISLFAEVDINKSGGFVEASTKGSTPRLALIRRFTLERFRPRQIREAMYAIGWHLGPQLLGFGQDMTGLGFPIYQDMEDDELCPPHLRNVSAAYMFNAKVETGVEAEDVTENQGVLRDHLGNMVKVIEDPYTNERKFVTMMPFIAASTRYIRMDVDSGYLLLPFDMEVTDDMLQETKQRVDRIGARESGMVKKGDRFHVLDSFRAMAFRRQQDSIDAQLAMSPQEDVLDLTL